MSYSLSRRYLLAITGGFLIGLSLSAQPGTRIKPKAPLKKTDPLCDSLQLILSNSASGFINYRYNENSGSASITYNTTLPALGFAKRFVQTGKVTPFKNTTIVTLPFYIASSSFTNETDARLFIKNFRQPLLACLKPSAKDTTLKPGFAYYNSFYLKQRADSFVTAELLLLSDNSSHTVIFRLFHNKAATGKGNMKNPPVVVNKNHYTTVLPLLQALLDYASSNFGAICDKLLVNQEWNPTFSSTVKYKDFTFPKVEYVTRNIWNQYTTSFYAANETIARQRFTELAAEIDQCQAAIPFQRYSMPDSRPDDKWWVYEHHRSDVAGDRYKNQLRLTLKKAEQGEGYIIRFEFRKSPGS